MPAPAHSVPQSVQTPAQANSVVKVNANGFYLCLGTSSRTKAARLGCVLKRKVRPVFVKLGVVGVGWHTFRHTVGTMLAEMGEHQLTIRDYLRHSNLSVTNKYLQAASKTKRNAQARVVEAILPVGAILPAGSKKQDSIQTKQSVFLGAMGNA